ncbi:MAG: antibiotic biosynthesis monooxygenase [Burkholderiales bacterium]|nr:antibiotic biosynthesis monooxygenase [Burkholderiales bacterium]
MGAFVLVVNVKIKAGEVEPFMQKLFANATAARETEPGCRQFDVSVDASDPTKVMFYEVYDDEAAFKAHQETPHFKRYIETALAHLESRERAFFKRVAP